MMDNIQRKCPNNSLLHFFCAGLLWHDVGLSVNYISSDLSPEVFLS